MKNVWSRKCLHYNTCVVEICVSVSELIIYMRCGYTGLYIHGIAALNNPNIPGILFFLFYLKSRHNS